MADEENELEIDRRTVLQRAGLATGIGAFGIPTVAADEEEDEYEEDKKDHDDDEHDDEHEREDDEIEEREMDEDDEREFVAEVRSSEQFKAVKKALKEEGFTPHMGEERGEQLHHIPSNEEGKQLEIPFKSNNSGEAKGYAFSPSTGDDIKMSVIVNRPENDGAATKVYYSDDQVKSVGNGVNVTRQANSLAKVSGGKD
ncbi:MAG: hypothetical protein SV253_03095 [Halobacteria archaeon]|nr:hypothetical protein [Halobacteria archaeon]